jgi:hypothetical protein
LDFTVERKGRGQSEKIHFKGIVKGHTMEGTVRLEGKPEVKEKWRAERIVSTFKPIEVSGN